jgi:iron(III) transport system substrate-binding protein
MTTQSPKRILLTRALLAGTFLTLVFPFSVALVKAQTAPAMEGKAAQEVNVYTNREPALFANTLSDFTTKTGIKVNTIFSDKGLAERIVAEGATSPADVLITVDAGKLYEAVEKNIAQPILSNLVDTVVPDSFHGEANTWVSLSMRARVIYASKERVNANALTYENLAEPKWKGRVCIRSGQHPYNIALFATMLAKKGEATTKQWLTGLKANLARKPSGGDRDVAKDIAAGVCDIGLGNTYYIGLMQTGTNEDQKKWASAVNVILPTFESGGTQVNVSGAVLIKTAPNKANAVKLIEHMLSADTQKIFADTNFEYPIRANIAVNPIIASFGELKPDATTMTAIAKARARASQLVDEVGFDQ